MKGSTHLSIGLAIGAVAVTHYPFSMKNAAWYLGVAACSALSADLDGPSILNRRIRKTARWIHRSFVGLSVCSGGGLLYQYVRNGYLNQEEVFITVIIVLLGLVAKESLLRNIMVSMVGGGMLFAGIKFSWDWLIGLGIFITWVPWLTHRGLSHTIWAVMLWGAIGWELEQHLQIAGIALVSLCGYASHLIADTVTPRGVKWFYPLYKRPIRLRS